MILVVVSLNGGWTADPQRNKPGRNLGYTRFDKMAETLSCFLEYIDTPVDEIRRSFETHNLTAQSTLSRPRTFARATTVTFAQYAT